MKTFKTPKGTELPFLNLKGKDYLQVQHRIIWFREDHPDWTIQTAFLRLDDQVAIAQATISDSNGRVLAMGTKMETPGSFKDGYVEKAESGSIGRALAFIGYGTQFAQELEDEQIVDTPQPSKSGATVTPINAGSDPGAYIIRMGKKWAGLSLDKVGPHDALSFATWLREQADQKKEPLNGVALETVRAIDAFVASREPKKVGQ